MKTLFDLCTIEEGRRRKGAICVKVKGHIGDGDAEQCMEERLLGESEYVLLRGSTDRTYAGLLSEVNITATRSLDETAVRDLYDAIPQKHREKAAFLMNAVTLHELYLTLGQDSGRPLKSTPQGGFTLLGAPVVLSTAMPCAGDGRVPVLYGDFSQITVSDCGRDELLRSSDTGVMTGYLDVHIADRDAVRGLKIV